MPRKLLPLALLTAALLLLAPFSAQAERVDCAQCGRSLDPAVCAYCPYCGVRVANALKITAAYQKRNGQVCLTWQDSGSHGPYTIQYRRYVNADYLAPAQQKELLWLDSDSQNTNQTTVFLKFMAPGYDYWIEVTGSRGALCRYHYSAPEPYAFADFAASLRLKCLRAGGSGSESQSAFSAAALAAAPESYGLYLRLEFSPLAQDRTDDLYIVFVDPLGSPIVTSSLENVVLESGWTNYGWDFYKLDWYLAQVKKQHGAILSGQYTVRCYLNGQLAGSGNFTVQ